MELQRGLAFAGGFGLARAVTSNAYITAFGAESGTNLGFVAQTGFSLVSNGMSAGLALAVVVLAMRGALGGRVWRLPVWTAPLAGALTAAGYALGAAGAFSRLPDEWSLALRCALYAAGMVALTLAWFELFAREPDVRFAVRSMVGGYLVQAAAFAALSLLSGWGLCVASLLVLALSMALMAYVRFSACERPARCGAAASRRPPRAGCPVPQPSPHTLREVAAGLFGSFVCVFTLTAVVGFLHTSVIGNDFEYVVGAVPMAAALVLATVLLALVVFASRRVPETSTVYRMLFPVMLVALSLLPFVTRALGPLSGMIMVVCYDLVGMAFVLLLLEVAHAGAVSPAALMGMYQAGTQLSLIAGLSLGLLLNGLHAGAGASYATVLILVCIYLLSMVLTVLLRRRNKTVASTLLEGLEPDAAAPACEDSAGGASASPLLERAAQQALRERVGERVERYAIERGLTPREAQVMVQLARGRSASVIATDLGMAENTAWAHIKRIYAKLGVHGKQELIDLIEREVIASGASNG